MESLINTNLILALLLILFLFGFFFWFFYIIDCKHEKLNLFSFAFLLSHSILLRFFNINKMKLVLKNLFAIHLYLILLIIQCLFTSTYKHCNINKNQLHHLVWSDIDYPQKCFTELLSDIKFLKKFLKVWQYWHSAQTKYILIQLFLLNYYLFIYLFDSFFVLWWFCPPFFY